MDERRTPAESFDVILCGGGLANSLIALALRARRPELRLLVLDEQLDPPSEHTWSAFETDMTGAWGQGLYGRFDFRWRGYAVSFPRCARDLTTGYASLTSSTLRNWLKEAVGAGLRQARVDEVGAEAVLCRDGRRFVAPLVVDGRGHRPSPLISCRFQKFLGLEAQLQGPHGLDAPIVMDARVPQTDGFRFLYVLPLSPTRVLLEDTRYSDRAALAPDDLEREIFAYAAGRGWPIARVVRREQGVLPVALGGDPQAYWRGMPEDVPQVGMRGLFFHPTTGYSLPDAIAVADLITGAPRLESSLIAAQLRERSLGLWRERSFYRLLNRMLFHAARPAQRYRVLERFYGLPQPLIERFYAGRSTSADKLRVLSGRPPVPIWAALRAIPESWWTHAAA